MRYFGFSIWFVAGLSACGSDDGGSPASGGGACTTVTGVYQETDVYDDPPGDCPQDAEAAAKPSTVTLTKDAAGAGTVSLESAALGGACPLVLDGCKASGKCEVRAKTGEALATLQVSWTFTDTGFTGFASVFTAKHPKTGKSCTANYRTTGAKK